MTIASPVRATSSIRARHLALNSEALIRRVIVRALLTMVTITIK